MTPHAEQTCDVGSNLPIFRKSLLTLSPFAGHFGCGVRRRGVAA